MNHWRTDAILAAKGVVTRTSLIVNGEDSVRAAREGLRAGIPMGLHFNITEGFPLSSPPPPLPPGHYEREEEGGRRQQQRAQPLLTIPNGTSCAGQFLGKRDAFLTLEAYDDLSNPMLRRSAVTAVAQELRAQLDRFVELTGVTDVWLDGHNHIHMLSIVWQAIEEVCWLRASESNSREESAEETSSSAAAEARWRVVGVRVPYDPSLVVVDEHRNGRGHDDEDQETAARQPSLRFKREEDIFGDGFWRRISHLASLRRASVPPYICCADLFVGFEIGGANASVDSVVWKVEDAVGAWNSAPPRWRPARMETLLKRNSANTNNNNNDGCINSIVVELMTHIGFAPEGGVDPDDDHQLPQHASSLFQDDAKQFRRMEFDTYTCDAFVEAVRSRLGGRLV